MMELIEITENDTAAQPINDLTDIPFQDRHEEWWLKNPEKG
ncbi:MAG: hypothetical protein WB014_08140 [Methanosarcina sp.]